MTDPHELWRLVCRPREPWGPAGVSYDVPGAVRMRQWVKLGLRAWGIEVVEIGRPDTYEVRAFQAFTRGRS